MSKYEMMRQKAANAVLRQRETVRGVITGGEVLLGATGGGYLAAQFPTVAGVPTDAAAGIAMLAAGAALKQRDMTALGLGMLAGYLHDVGGQLAASYPVK